MNIIQDLFDSVISDSISQGYQFLSFLLIASGDIATSLIVAKTEGELDLKTYAS